MNDFRDYFSGSFQKEMPEGFSNGLNPKGYHAHYKRTQIVVKFFDIINELTNGFRKDITIDDLPEDIKQFTLDIANDKGFRAASFGQGKISPRSPPRLLYKLACALKDNLTDMRKGIFNHFRGNAGIEKYIAKMKESFQVEYLDKQKLSNGV